MERNVVDEVVAAADDAVFGGVGGDEQRSTQSGGAEDSFDFNTDVSTKDGIGLLEDPSGIRLGHIGCIFCDNSRYIHRGQTASVGIDAEDLSCRSGLES